MTTKLSKMELRAAAEVVAFHTFSGAATKRGRFKRNRKNLKRVHKIADAFGKLDDNQLTKLDQNDIIQLVLSALGWVFRLFVPYSLIAEIVIALIKLYWKNV